LGRPARSEILIQQSVGPIDQWSIASPAGAAHDTAVASDEAAPVCKSAAAT
jgi:hypothetical protein